MKESKFIEQNNQKWDELETTLESDLQDPKEKSRLFVQVVDDLSYARTFYKNRSVREYLNGMSHLLFSDLNLNERFSLKDFFGFFTTTFPKAMYFTRRSMLVSFIVFVASFIIGALTAANDPGFASEILSNDYVNMTEENIDKGDPMAVYKDHGEFEMFVYIAINNLRVAFITFVFGILSSIGSIFIMITNGAMVGVFQYFFFERGMFWPSFLGIWTHGTIEIACIIVAGGAGIQLGKGLLFPGTYSRAEAFKASGKSALAVIAGITPLIVLAAFIESFLTRHTELPDALRFGFIMLCLAFVLFYFFWYPRYKYKNDPTASKQFEVMAQPAPKSTFNPTDILKTEKIIAEVIGHFLRNTTKALSLLIIPILAFAYVLVWGPTELFMDPVFITLAEFDLKYMFGQDDMFYIACVVIGITTLILSLSSFTMVRQYMPETSTTWLSRLKIVLLCAVFSLLMYALLSFSNFFGILAFLFFGPLLLQSLAINNFEKGSILIGPKLIMVYLKSNWGKFIGVNGLLLIMAICFYLIVNQLVMPFLAPTLSMLFTDKIYTEQQISFMLSTMATGLSFFGLIYFYNIGAHMLYFTLRETNTASHLFSRIKTLLID